MAEASNEEKVYLNSLPKAFLSNLLTKIGNSMLEAQEEAYFEEFSDELNLRFIGEALQKFRHQPGEVVALARLFNLELKPRAEVDETVLTVKNLNQFIINALENGIKWNLDMTYEVRCVKELYQLVKRSDSAISPGDSIMAHVASNSALSEELETQAPPETGEDIIIPSLDEEDLDKYISIFSGEEYSNGRKDNPKGDIE